MSARFAREMQRTKTLSKRELIYGLMHADSSSTSITDHGLQIGRLNFRSTGIREALEAARTDPPKLGTLMPSRTTYNWTNLYRYYRVRPAHMTLLNLYLYSCELGKIPSWKGYEYRASWPLTEDFAYGLALRFIPWRDGGPEELREPDADWDGTVATRISHLTYIPAALRLFNDITACPPQIRRQILAARTRFHNKEGEGTAHDVAAAGADPTQQARSSQQAQAAAAFGAISQDIDNGGGSSFESGFGSCFEYKKDGLHAGPVSLSWSNRTVCSDAGCECHTTGEEWTNRQKDRYSKEAMHHSAAPALPSFFHPSNAIGEGQQRNCATILYTYFTQIDTEEIINNRFLVCGAAGVGKSFSSTTCANMTQHFEEALSPSDSLPRTMLALAPTANAATLLKIDPHSRIATTRRAAPMPHTSAQRKQHPSIAARSHSSDAYIERFKGVTMIVVDETSMEACGSLTWTAHHIKNGCELNYQLKHKEMVHRDTEGSDEGASETKLPPPQVPKSPRRSKRNAVAASPRETSDDAFGTRVRTVFLYGDLWQLPPVGGTSPYTCSAPPATVPMTALRAGWDIVDHIVRQAGVPGSGVIFLDYIVRQTDEMQKKVQEDIKLGTSTPATHAYLKRHSLANLKRVHARLNLPILLTTLVAATSGAQHLAAVAIAPAGAVYVRCCNAAAAAALCTALGNDRGVHIAKCFSEGGATGEETKDERLYYQGDHSANNTESCFSALLLSSHPPRGWIALTLVDACKRFEHPDGAAASLIARVVAVAVANGTLAEDSSTVNIYVRDISLTFDTLRKADKFVHWATQPGANSKYIFAETERGLFAEPSALNISPTWKMCDAHVLKMLLRVPIRPCCISRANFQPSTTGGRDHSRTKQCGLPDCVAFRIGDRVLLLQNFAVPLKLVNGAVGRVAEIVYAERDGPRADSAAQPLYVVVDFEGRVQAPPGEQPWCTARPNLIPIPVFEQRCEKRCCSKFQIPLVHAGSVSIHKCQGMSIGWGEVWRRIVVAWGGSKAQRSPGSHVTSTTRAKTPDDMAMSDNDGAGPQMDDVMNTGRGKPYTDRKADVKRLRAAAAKTTVWLDAWVTKGPPDHTPTNFDAGYKAWVARYTSYTGHTCPPREVRIDAASSAGLEVMVDPEVMDASDDVEGVHATAADISPSAAREQFLQTVKRNRTRITVTQTLMFFWDSMLAHNAGADNDNMRGCILECAEQQIARASEFTLDPSQLYAPSFLIDCGVGWDTIASLLRPASYVWADTIARHFRLQQQTASASIGGTNYAWVNPNWFTNVVLRQHEETRHGVHLPKTATDLSRRMKVYDDILHDVDDSLLSMSSPTMWGKTAFVPVCIFNGHWVLLTIDVENNRVVLYDSYEPSQHWRIVTNWEGVSSLRTEGATRSGRNLHKLLKEYGALIIEAWRAQNETFNNDKAEEKRTGSTFIQASTDAVANACGVCVIVCAKDLSMGIPPHMRNCPGAQQQSTRDLAYRLNVLRELATRRLS
jgi:hypothetical protein